MKPPIPKLFLRFSGIFIIPIVLIFLQGCATIFGSRSNTLVFEGDPSVKAEVFIDDIPIGSAPGKIVLDSRTIQHGSILKIKAEGFKEQEYLILRKPHAAYMVADFIVGAIPLVVDAGTGQLYRPSPRKFTVDLTKEGQ